MYAHRMMVNLISLHHLKYIGYFILQKMEFIDLCSFALILKTFGPEFAVSVVLISLAMCVVGRIFRGYPIVPILLGVGMLGWIRSWMHLLTSKV